MNLWRIYGGVRITREINKRCKKMLILCFVFKHLYNNLVNTFIMPFISRLYKLQASLNTSNSINS